MSKPTDHNSENPEKRIAHIPTIEYFQKTYGKNMEGSDQKAANVFKNYESQEKLRRFQNELQWIKNGQVTNQTCDRVIGRKRKGKHTSYERWAELMLLWLAGTRK